MEARLHEATGATMPAGRYFVGDPCYAVPNEYWMDWLRDSYKNGGADFDARTGGSPKVLLAEIKGHPVLGIGTAHGDGVYGGSDGFAYGVDAGLIGLVPMSLPGAEDEVRAYLGTVVEFEEPFECRYEGGTIILGHIRIETDPEEDDEE